MLPFCYRNHKCNSHDGDADADNAVVTKFASGCAAIISFDTMARASLPPSKSTDICDDESFYNTLSNSL